MSLAGLALLVSNLVKVEANNHAIGVMPLAFVQVRSNAVIQIAGEYQKLACSGFKSYFRPTLCQSRLSRVIFWFVHDVLGAWVNKFYITTSFGCLNIVNATPDRPWVNM